MKERILVSLKISPFEMQLQARNGKDQRPPPSPGLGRDVSSLDVPEEEWFGPHLISDLQ